MSTDDPTLKYDTLVAAMRAKEVERGPVARLCGIMVYEDGSIANVGGLRWQDWACIKVLADFHISNMLSSQLKSPGGGTVVGPKEGA